MPSKMRAGYEKGAMMHELADAIARLVLDPYEVLDYCGDEVEETEEMLRFHPEELARKINERLDDLGL